MQQSTKNCIRKATETTVLVHLVSGRYISQITRITGHASIVHRRQHSLVASERISAVVPSTRRISVSTERSHVAGEHSVVRKVGIAGSFAVSQDRSLSLRTTINELGKPNRVYSHQKEQQRYPTARKAIRAMIGNVLVVLPEFLGRHKEIKTDSTEEVHFQTVDLVHTNASHFGIKSVCVVHVIEIFGRNHHAKRERNRKTSNEVRIKR